MDKEQLLLAAICSLLGGSAIGISSHAVTHSLRSVLSYGVRPPSANRVPLRRRSHPPFMDQQMPPPPPVAMVENLIRLSNGNYLAGFRLQLHETFYAHPEIVEEQHRRLTAWLSTSGLPVGTTFQFREAIHPVERFQVLLPELHAPPGIQERMDASFPGVPQQLSRMSWWRRRHLAELAQVPLPYIVRGLTLFVSVGSDGERTSGWKHAISDLREFFPNARRYGVREALRMLLSSSSLIRRFADEEYRAFLKAKDVLSSLAVGLPFEGRMMNAAELWRCIYLGYHESAEVEGGLPAPYTDLASRLSGDRMIFAKDAIIHDRVPVVILSLTNPPQVGSGISAGAFPGIFRPIYTMGDGHFRHVFINEYRVLDQLKLRAKYDRMIQMNEKFGVGIFNGRLTPEARQKHLELNELRADMATGRTTVMAGRHAVLIYGPPLDPAEAERVAETGSLRAVNPAVAEELQRRVNQMATAYRQISGCTFPGPFCAKPRSARQWSWCSETGRPGFPGESRSDVRAGEGACAAWCS